MLPHAADPRRLHLFFACHVSFSPTHPLIGVGKTINRVSCKRCALREEDRTCKNILR